MPYQPEQIFVDAGFPFRGIDISSEFGSQRDGTTPVGKNVRAFEPTSERMRGGSRPGLSKYIGEQVDWEDEAFDNVIQHLNYIVDPTVDAIRGNFDDGTDEGGTPGTFTDVSTNNRRRRFPLSPPGLTRKIRDGGSGRRQSRKTPKPVLTITANNRTKDQGQTVTFAGTEISVSGLLAGHTITSATLNSRGAVASASATPPGKFYRIIPSAAVLLGSADSITRVYRVRYLPGQMTVTPKPAYRQGRIVNLGQGSGGSVAFTMNVKTGSLIVVAVAALKEDSNGMVFSVSDSLGQTYLLGPAFFDSMTGVDYDLGGFDIHYRVASRSGPCTVTVSSIHSGVNPHLILAIAEYVSLAPPNSSISEEYPRDTSAVDISDGSSITVNSTFSYASLLIAAAFQMDGGGTPSFGSATTRLSLSGTNSLCLADGPVVGPGAVSASFTGSTDNWVAGLIGFAAPP